MRDSQVRVKGELMGFKYNDYVLIKSGFYEGLKGKIVDIYFQTDETIEYRIKIKSSKFIIENINNLEKTKKPKKKFEEDKKKKRRSR